MENHDQTPKRAAGTIDGRVDETGNFGDVVNI
jgi:hypothetical protein